MTESGFTECLSAWEKDNVIHREPIAGPPKNIYIRLSNLCTTHPKSRSSFFSSSLLNRQIDKSSRLLSKWNAKKIVHRSFENLTFRRIWKKRGGIRTGLWSMGACSSLTRIFDRLSGFMKKAVISWQLIWEAIEKGKKRDISEKKVSYFTWVHLLLSQMHGCTVLPKIINYFYSINTTVYKHKTENIFSHKNRFQNRTKKKIFLLAHTVMQCTYS